MSRKVPQDQINIRIDAGLYEVLEAAAFVERATVSELARDAVHGIARTYSSEPAVQAALSARQSHGLTEQV